MLKKFNGEYLKGIIEGKGQIERKNGSIVEANFKNGIYWTQGKITYPNGQIYEGEL